MTLVSQKISRERAPMIKREDEERLTLFWATWHGDIIACTQKPACAGLLRWLRIVDEVRTYCDY